MQKGETQVPREQPQLRVQLGYKNGLNGMSHIHCDKTITTVMSRLTPEQRERTLGMVQMGATRAFITRTIRCSHVAVTSLMHRYKQTEQTCQEQTYLQ